MSAEGLASLMATLVDENISSFEEAQPTAELIDWINRAYCSSEALLEALPHALQHKSDRVVSLMHRCIVSIVRHANFDLTTRVHTLRLTDTLQGLSV
jgi:hypothetical protein